MATDRDCAASRHHQQSDLALVDAARDNPDAFGPLYERHVDRVHAYALKRLRDPDLADDATARAFSRALAGLDRFTPAREQVESGSSFIRWLMTIARNSVVDIVREWAGIVALDPGALEALRSATGDDPAASLPPDDRDRIEQAIRDLGSPQQEIVVLRLQGWKGVEIADLLGMTHVAVRVAQHRAYGRLRETLASFHPSSGTPNHGEHA